MLSGARRGAPRVAGAAARPSPRPLLLPQRVPGPHRQRAVRVGLAPPRAADDRGAAGAPGAGAADTAGAPPQPGAPPIAGVVGGAPRVPEGASTDLGVLYRRFLKVQGAWGGSEVLRAGPAEPKAAERRHGAVGSAITLLHTPRPRRQLALPYWQETPGARWKLAGVVGLTLAGTGVRFPGVGCGQLRGHGLAPQPPGPQQRPPLLSTPHNTPPNAARLRPWHPSPPIPPASSSTSSGATL
jgi:hypothetical protein